MYYAILFYTFAKPAALIFLIAYIARTTVACTLMLGLHHWTSFQNGSLHVPEQCCIPIAVTRDAVRVRHMLDGDTQILSLYWIVINIRVTLRHVYITANSNAFCTPELHRMPKNGLCCVYYELYLSCLGNLHWGWHAGVERKEDEGYKRRLQESKRKHPVSKEWRHSWRLVSLEQQLHINSNITHMHLDT